MGKTLSNEAYAFYSYFKSIQAKVDISMRFNTENTVITIKTASTSIEYNGEDVKKLIARIKNYYDKNSIRCENCESWMTYLGENKSVCNNCGFIKKESLKKEEQSKLIESIMKKDEIDKLY